LQASGSDVTLIYRGENILRGFDDDIRIHLRAEMEKEGVTILTGNTVSKVEKHGREFTTHLCDGSNIASDQVMFAIGRHPNVVNLGLENAGVAINPRDGGIAVDGFSRTSVPNIYAIGDVTHRNNRHRLPSAKVTLSRYRIRQAFCAGRLPGHSDRGILAAGSRHGRVDRSAGPRAVQPRRYLQDRFSGRSSQRFQAAMRAS